MNCRKKILCVMFALCGLASVGDASAAAGWADDAWRCVFERFYVPSVHLLYDYRVDGADDGLVRCLPTADEIRDGFPNPCGWGTGMEDSVLLGAPMLLAAMHRWVATGDAVAAKRAHDLFSGLVACAEVSGVPGFVARSISPRDGRSFYTNSSRDQYTLFVYALWRFRACALATAAEREKAEKLLVDVARYCEKCVTRENGYMLLRADGGQSLVCKMWADDPAAPQPPGGLEAHEVTRLVMFYAAAYAVSGDVHWREMELRYADKAIGVARTWKTRCRGFINGFALFQTQCARRLLWECESDQERRGRYLGLLNDGADMAAFADANIEESRKAINGDLYPAGTDWRKRMMWYMTPFWSHGPSVPVGGIRYLMPKKNDHEQHAYRYAGEIPESVLNVMLCPGREVPRETQRRLDEFMASFDGFRFNRPKAQVHALLAYWARRAGAAKR